MRKGRYRFQMIEEEQLNKWAEPLSRLFELWQREVKEGNLAPWDFVARYLLIFVFLNRPHEKWSKQGHKKDFDRLGRMNHQVKEAFGGVLNEDHLNQWEKCSPWIYGDLANLRGVPEKVLRSLRGWREGSFDLFLIHFIPSAKELLAFQVQGKRCVTALVTSDQIKIPAETGRDVWSFCLHDLLHASHFFADAKQNSSQKYLASFFLEAWEQPLFQSWLSKDPQFAADFTYVAADMNAHPVYIFLSFYAKVLEYFKRQKGYSTAEVLSFAEELQWRDLWEKFLGEVTKSSEAQEVLGSLCETHGRLAPEQLTKIDSFLAARGVP